MLAALALALTAPAAGAGAGQAAPPPLAGAARYRACLAQAATAPAAAAAAAAAWAGEGGGAPARHCRAVALLGAGRAGDARIELETAAKLSAAEGGAMTAALWGQAGNAALIAGNAPAARTALTNALAAGTNAALDARAGWRVDRARAAVAASDPVAARADLDAALLLAPEDPQALLFSAALAWRMKDGPRARREIVAARRLAPGDAVIAAEARRIGRAAMDSPAGRASEPVVPLLNPLY